MVGRKVMGGRGRSVAPSQASPQRSSGAAERLRDSVAAPFGPAIFAGPPITPASFCATAAVPQDQPALKLPYVPHPAVPRALPDSAKISHAALLFSLLATSPHPELRGAFLTSPRSTCTLLIRRVCTNNSSPVRQQQSTQGSGASQHPVSSCRSP